MKRKLLQNFGLNHTTQRVYSIILSIGLFIVGFNQNVAAQCSITTSGIVNASTFTCGTSPLSTCNGTLTVGNGSSITSVYMDAELNLTCLGPIQLIVKNKGSFDFSPGNNRLLLAEGSSIIFEPGSDLIGGSCNASERIYIGTNLLASCNGGSGADLSFADLLVYAGTGSLTSNSPVCVGSQITLTATPPPTSSGTFTYSFSGPGLAATFFSSSPTYSFTATAGSGGTYQVKIKNSGITNPMIAENSVSINTLPATPTITAGSSTTFCAGGSVSLTSSVGTSYLWSTGATTQSISPATSGSYTVQVTNASGCQSASSLATVVTVNPISAIVLTSGTQSPTVCAGRAITNTVYTFSGSATNASVSGLPAGLSQVIDTSAKTVTISGTPTAGGTYTITTSGHTAPCTAATISGTVTVNPSPNNVINGFSATTICAGGSPQLTYNAEASSFSTPYSITYRNDVTLLQYTIAIPSSSAYSFTPADNPTSNTGYTLVSISNASCTTTTASIVDSGANLIVRPMPTATIGGTTSVCVGGSSPNITFTNPQTVAITVTYTINGGANQTINVAASSFSNIAVATSAAGTFIYNLISVVYQSSPNCSNTLSGSATVTVNPNLPASVSISASPSGAICSGTSVSFTAAPTNGGATPAYQWKLNAVNVGSNSTTYTNAALVNGDIVTCVMTSNATPCLTASPAISNTVTMTVNPNLPASVSVSASPSGAICSGTSVSFTAIPTNGGTTPAYQWKLNGVNVGSNSTTYTNAALANGDVVTCVMTSNATPCLTASPATSNAIAMTVNPNLPASVSISASPAGVICSGTSVMFTATPTNGGTTPAYQWKLNGVNVGSNSTTYTNASLVNGDVVTCIMTSNATPCLTSSPATSNAITMTVNPNLPASVSISALPSGAICSGTSVTFTATPTNGGTTPAYQWKLNGVNVGSNSTTYTNAALINGDVVTCVMTSNATPCLTASPATSNAITMTVNPLPTTPTVGTLIQPTCVVPTGSVVLSGLPASGTWTINPGGYTGTGTTTTIPSLAVGTYNFTVSNGSCTSSAITVVINPVITNTWNGSAWSDGGNPPTSLQAIVFNGNFSSTADLEACSCQVTSGANVVINSGHTLKITNQVQVLGTGLLTFENNASLVQLNDATVNTGNINYKRYTTPVRRYDFTYWSSPVAGQTLYNLSPNTLGDKYYGYNPNTGWVIYYNGAATMLAGNGYLVRAPETFSTTVATVDITPVFIGIPNNGIINLTLAANKAYLLGNPYPSAIDADVFLDANSTVLEGTLYFWTHNSPPSNTVAGDALYNYTADDYATYNRTGGVSTSFAAKTGGTAPTGKIAAGQGFFAPASVSGGSLIFNNSMRISGGTSGTNNSQFYKLSVTSKSNTTASTIEKNRIWLNLTNKEGAFKQTLVGYVTGATNDFDGGFDGVSYDGNQFVDFYSVNQGLNLSIQGRALPFMQKDSVVLGYKSTIKGDFQIGIDHSDGELTSQAVFLEDKVLNVLYDLRKEPYSFSTEKGVFDNRFVLRYENNNVVKKNTEKEVISDEGVIVWVFNNEIKVSSSRDLITKIIIYDILGKVVYQKDELATTDYLIQHLNLAHQVLFVDVILGNEKIVSTKIVY
jgi:hypothetical protein